METHDLIKKFGLDVGDVIEYNGKTLTISGVNKNCNTREYGISRGFSGSCGVCPGKLTFLNFDEEYHDGCFGTTTGFLFDVVYQQRNNDDLLGDLDDIIEELKDL